MPFECRCGAWLRMKPLRFNWVDVAGLVLLATIQLFVAVRFWWARNSFLFFIPLGLWFMYRTSRQITVEEVPAPWLEQKDVA